MINLKIITALIISALIIFGVYFFVSMENATQSGNSIKILGTGSSVIENNIIEIRADGFFPEILSVSVGDEIIFTNKDKNNHRIISDSLYLSKELKSEENFQIPMNSAGDFEYYDALNPNLKGTIVVK
jgi:plastocyanin